MKSRIFFNPLNDVISTVDSKLDANSDYNKARESFFTNLLTFDEIYMEESSITFLLNILGYRDTLKLLDENIINFVNFGNIIIMVDKAMKKVSSYSITNEYSFLEDERIKLYLSDKFSEISDTQMKTLLVRARNNSISNTDRLAYSNKEAETFLNSKNLIVDNMMVNRFGLTDNIISKLTLSSKDLLNGYFTGTPYLNIGSTRNEVIDLKNHEFLRLSNNNVLEDLEYSFKSNGIPDLSTLYFNNLIDLDYIISLRLSDNSFREKILELEYTKEEMIDFLLGVNSNLTLKDFNDIRTLITTNIGYVNSADVKDFIPDDFIFNKILMDISYNFIPNPYKYLLDKDDIYLKCRYYLETIKLSPNYNRNNKCTCSSNKKFKNCCGSYKVQEFLRDTHI